MGLVVVSRVVLSEDLVNLHPYGAPWPTPSSAQMGNGCGPVQSGSQLLQHPLRVPIRPSISKIQ